jgi:hypothetical protein
MAEAHTAQTCPEDGGTVQLCEASPVHTWIHMIGGTITETSIFRWIVKAPAKAGALAGWFQQGCGVISSIAIIPMLTSKLGLYDAGRWLSLSAGVQIAGLTDMGLTIVYARQIAYSLGLKVLGARVTPGFVDTRPGWPGVLQVYATAKNDFRKVYVAALILVVAFFGFICSRKVNDGSADIIGVCCFLGASYILTIALKPGVALMEGVGGLAIARVLTGSGQLVTMAGILVLLNGGFRLLALSAWVCFVSLGVLMLQKLLVTIILSPHRSHHSSEVPDGSLFKLALPFGLVNLGAFLAAQIQVPLLGAMVGPAAVPAYYSAQRLAQFASLACMQLVLPQLPLFTMEFAQGDRRIWKRRMVSCIRNVTCFAVLASVAFFLSVNSVVGYMTSGKLLDRSVVLVMSVDLFLLCASVVWGHFVIASGNATLAYFNLCAGIVNVLIISIFLGGCGLIAVPVAALVSGLLFSYSGSLILGWKLLRRC